MRSVITWIFALSMALGGLLLAPTEVRAQDAAAAPVSTEPGDQIVMHINAMTKIVESNMDQPDKALTDFEKYIKEHATEMRTANKKFAAKLKSLAADERQRAQDSLQRKLEKPLQSFMKIMLDFGKKYPDKAKALDEKLQKASAP